MMAGYLPGDRGRALKNGLSLLPGSCPHDGGAAQEAELTAGPRPRHVAPSGV